MKNDPSPTQVLWFGSAIDWWLALILIAVPTRLIWALIAALRESDAVAEAVFGCVVIAAIYGLLLIPMRYGVSNDQLIIRFGVVRRRIPLANIHEVYPTRNPLASPALSLNRLAVRTGEGMAPMVSPSDRAGFLKVLASRAGLASEGDRLVRRQAGGGSV